MGNSMTKKREKRNNASRERREQTMLQSWEFCEAMPQMAEARAEEIKLRVGADAIKAENVVLKSALKNKWRREQASNSRRRSFKHVRKDVRFNLAEVEITEGDPMPPLSPGYGLKFLECVRPGKDEEKAPEIVSESENNSSSKGHLNEESIGEL